MKSTLLVKMPFIYKGKNGNMCDEECPHLRVSKDNTPVCRLFGKLAFNKNITFREEDCIEAEDAAYHLSILMEKLK